MQIELIKNIDVWSPEIIGLLILSGFIIGVINTLAGSGTAISYAVFMSLGLPPAWANGTVRIGVIPQTFAAGLNFYKHKLLNIKNAVFIAVPITIGSVLGAEIAVNINQEIFKKVIGIAMLIILFFVIFKPEKFLKGEVSKINKYRTSILAYYFVFFYRNIRRIYSRRCRYLFINCLGCRFRLRPCKG
ncbi:MAG: sulfite exporter TauE/SafE family protein [Chlorobi bacterium]|nr:sulfite exporter TauE/SafE family protein [Chlorobiota bacterium]